jgi:hypothetical protein
MDVTNIGTIGIRVKTLIEARSDADGTKPGLRLNCMGGGGGGGGWGARFRCRQDLVRNLEKLSCRGLVSQSGHNVRLGIKPAAGVIPLPVLLNDFENLTGARSRLQAFRFCEPVRR